MAEAKATAPELVLSTEIEMNAAMIERDRVFSMALDLPAPSITDLVVRACALALRDVPRANGAYRDGQFERYSRVNVGMVVAAHDALIVPTIQDADRKGIAEIAGEARTLTERVRANEVAARELSGATFTVSNLDMDGVTRFTAVLHPPQAAILAVGAMTERPVVRDGEVTVRLIMDATLTCDHRILYGPEAARFLTAIRGHLEAPQRLAG
jgi:pyruvate dehydrogenase E2 component (dihydrolipoamide acetyltransferase)